MNFNSWILGTLCLFCFSGRPVYSQKVPEKMDLVLLIGQSNMAGRGKVEPSDREVTPGLWMINAANEWVPAVDPVHYDKPGMAGVGPGLSFARKVYQQRNKRAIGLIPCAVGGSRISDWERGVRHEQTGIVAYDAMLARVKEAQKHGKLKVILWHQGEGDSSKERSALYEQRLTELFTRLRKDLKAEKVPVILATLGDYYLAKAPAAAKINEVLLAYPQSHPYFHVVSSDGLHHKGDGTHFDAASARTLGERYAEMFLKVTGKK